MKPRRDWKQYLKELENPDMYDDCELEMAADSFGGNTFNSNKDAARFFKRLEKLGGIIEILDYENINLILPKSAKQREALYLEMLIYGGHTGIKYRPKIDALEIEWS